MPCPRITVVALALLLCLLAVTPADAARGGFRNNQRQDVHNQLDNAQELLNQAKNKIKYERESMRREKEKLKVDLKKAIVDLRKMTDENKKLRIQLRDVENTLEDLKAQVESPIVQQLLDETANTVNEYLHSIDNFEDVEIAVESLTNDIEARMQVVFGQEYSGIATTTVVLIAVFVPLIVGFLVMRRLVKLLSKSAYAVMFSTFIFVYVIAIELLAIFTNGDPFTAFRTMSEAWYVTAQYVLLFFAIVLVYLLLSLALADEDSSIRQLHVAQIVLAIVLSFDYGLRVWLPSVTHADLSPMPAPVLAAYVLGTATVLLLGIRVESLKRNLKSPAVEAASSALFEGEPANGGEGDSQTKEV